MDGDENYKGTEAIYDPLRVLSPIAPPVVSVLEEGKIDYETFVALVCFQFGRYEMLHRDVMVPLDDTLFREGLLVDEEDGPQYQSFDMSLNGVKVHACLVPVVDVLWARARLEGYPNGGAPVLADVATPSEHIIPDAHSL